MGDEYVEHRYLTDDRDRTNRCELVVYWAPNGDYYVGVCQEGDKLVRNVVRICTSGGAASRNPKLRDAVVDLFQALGGWDKNPPEADPAESIRKGEHDGCWPGYDIVEAWVSRTPITMLPGLIEQAVRSAVEGEVFNPGQLVKFVERAERKAAEEKR